MATTARDLVFIIRAENQATRAIKSMARDFGSLGRLKAAQNAAAEAAAKASLANEAKLSRIQQQMRVNTNALNAAEERLQKTRSAAAKLTAAANDKILTQDRAIQEQLAKIQTQESKLAETRRATTMFGQPGQLRALPGKNYSETQEILSRQAADLTNMQAAHAQMQQRLAIAQGVPANIAAAEAASLAVQAERIGTLTARQKMLARSSDEVAAAGKRQAAEWDRLGRILPYQRLSAFGAMLQRIGRTARLTGIVTGAVFGALAVHAARFESQTTLAATQARPNDAPISATANIANRLNTEILKQMQRFPATAKEMSDSFYQIFSGTNIQGVKEAAKDVEVFNKMAVAGSSSLDSMTQAGISIRNIFPSEFKNMTDAANVFFAAVRYGRTTADQLAQSLGYISPLVKDAGISFRGLAQDMAFFTRQTGGNMTRQDAQGLARLIQLFARADVQAGLASKGINVFNQQTGRMRPIVEILGEIHDKLKLNPQETLNFFKTISASGSGKGGTQGTIQAIRIFSQGINNIKAYREVAQRVAGDNDEMTKSFLAMQRTPGVRWEVFTNQMKALAIVVGEQAIPAFLSMAKPVTSLLHWFNNLSNGNKKLIAQFAVYGSVGAIVAGTFLGIAGSVLKLVAAMRIIALSGGLRVALGLGGEAGMAAAGAAIPLGVIAGIAGLIILLHQYPGALSAASNAIGGLRGAMLALGIVIAGLTFRSLLLSLAVVGESLAGASAATLILRSRLLSLGLIAIPAIVIPVIYKVSKDLQSTHGHDVRQAQYSKNPFVGGVQRAQDSLTYGFDRLFGRSPTESREAVAGTNNMGLTLFPHETKMKTISDFMKRRVGNLLGDMQVSMSDLEKATKAAYNGDYETFNKIYKKYLPSASKRVQNLRDANPRAISLAGQALTAQQGAVKTVLTKTFMQRLREVADLSAKYEKDHSLASLKKLQDARTLLDRDYNSKLYQTYIDDYLSRVESADKKSVKKRIDEGKKQAKAAAKELSNAYSNIMSTYQTFLQQNQTNFGSLFSGPFINSPGVQARLGINNNKVTSQDVLRDLHSQLFQFNRLNTNIRQIGRRGGPQSLIDQLRAAGPGALPDIEAINKMSGPQFREYVATWRKSQNAIKSATMSQLQHQIAIYRKFGSKVALAIIAGIKGEDPKLQNELERVINRMFPDLAKKAAKAPNVTPTGSKGSLAPVQHQTTHHSTTNLHVHNPVSHSVETSTKKALFAIKTRKR